MLLSTSSSLSYGVIYIARGQIVDYDLNISPRLFKSLLLGCPVATMMWIEKKLGFNPTNNTTILNMLCLYLHVLLEKNERVKKLNQSKFFQSDRNEILKFIFILAYFLFQSIFYFIKLIFIIKPGAEVSINTSRSTSSYHQFLLQLSSGN